MPALREAGPDARDPGRTRGAIGVEPALDDRSLTGGAAKSAGTGSPRDAARFTA